MRVIALETSAALKRGRRALAATEKELLVRLARFVGTIPDERLEQLMRSPARRAIVETIFWQMPHQLNRTRATGIETVVRWRITTPSAREAELYNLVIVDRRARVIRGPGGPDPRVTITVDAAEFLRLAAGRSNPMQAYFAGKLALTGDIMQAARLTALFHVPVTAPRPAARGRP
jgi:hypothetical protein